MSWSHRLILILPAILTWGGVYAVWSWNLEKARLYRGESSVVPDRTWAWIRSEWYQPEALPWLQLVRVLLVLSLPSGLLALTAIAQ